MARVISGQEMDFLNSYKTHMNNVYKELERFKRKTNENEFLIRKDEKVMKLQKQADWFKKEALDLAEREKKSLTAIERLKEKVCILEEEKIYLQAATNRKKQKSTQLKLALQAT